MGNTNIQWMLFLFSLLSRIRGVMRRTARQPQPQSLPSGDRVPG